MFPGHSNEHFALTFLCGSQAHDLHLLSFAQGRDRPLGDTFGLEGKTHLLFEIVVPSHGLLLSYKEDSGGRYQESEVLLWDLCVPLWQFRAFVATRLRWGLRFQPFEHEIVWEA